MGCFSPRFFFFAYTFFTFVIFYAIFAGHFSNNDRLKKKKKIEHVQSTDSLFSFSYVNGLSEKRRVFISYFITCLPGGQNKLENIFQAVNINGVHL